MRVLALLMFVCVATVTPLKAGEFDHTHKAWNSLLHNHVYWINGGTASQVDYSGMLKDQARLDSYNASLSNVSRPEFDSWGKAEQLAFLINAYNSFTVTLVLTEYPNLDSIKDIGGWFGSPWKKKFFSLLGRKRTLNEVEHDLIRGSGRYNEPLIHAAIVCASIGCPALRPDAFMAKKLESQLTDSMRRFMSDGSRNAYSNGRLIVSKIFDWYEEDFSNLEAFFALHAEQLARSSVDRQRIRAGDYLLVFGDYNWALNDKL